MEPRSWADCVLDGLRAWRTTLDLLGLSQWRDARDRRRRSSGDPYRSTVVGSVACSGLNGQMPECNPSEGVRMHCNCARSSGSDVRREPSPRGVTHREYYRAVLRSGDRGVGWEIRGDFPSKVGARLHQDRQPAI